NTERDKELVEEFEYLLEKSQQLFLGISDLPEIGSKYWMPHFQRTFEVFTKLWKFQNHHRVLLEKPEHYGLKRWEVGEIASKIGQLYYRYYLRTSETNYLQESYVFYDAIRERNYFKGEQEVRNSALMIKKLRYYARFIVVCLQLGNTPMMLQLLDEVKSLIDVYSATFNPVDKMEWSLVVKEMALFMQAVCNPVPTDENGALLQTNYRLVSRRRPRLEKDGSKFRLQEAVIVGNRPTQIKFSELTLDMYHVLQMLEREPSALLKETNPSGATTTEAATITTPTAEASTTADKDKDKVSRRVNPHKYVLYQPSFSHIQVYLASAFKEIGDQGCVLLYLSSDGSSVGNSPESGENNNAAATHGLIGGISTIRRNASDTGRDRSMEQLINTVHPADLVPYTRKPFFLVVESESSRAYKNMPNLFNQPLLCLLSPTSYPIPCSYGSIYTFFLHSPIVAFSAISQITKMEAHKWSELEALFNELEDLVFELLNICVTDHSTRRFLGDDFLRQIMIRHILCCAVLGHHRDFTWPEHWPQSSPETFSEVISAHALTHKVRYIIVFCSVEEFYRMDDGSPEPTT
ncbi:protein SCAI, partial [Coemansia spiralis]